MKQSFKIRHTCCREQKTCYSWAVRKTSPYVPCIYSMLEPGKYFRAPFKKGETHMSITVNLYYTGENGNALKFAQEMENSGTADAIRREEGNLRYEYFQPLQDKETVLLIDSWESSISMMAMTEIF